MQQENFPQRAIIMCQQWKWTANTKLKISEEIDLVYEKKSAECTRVRSKQADLLLPNVFFGNKFHKSHNFVCVCIQGTWASVGICTFFSDQRFTVLILGTTQQEIRYIKTWCDKLNIFQQVLHVWWVFWIHENGMMMMTWQLHTKYVQMRWA